MATINLGRVKPVFRGAYSGATAYVVDDIVTYSNETYICILASTGNLPTDTTYWTKLAAKGTDGTDLTTTLTTQGDLVVRGASGLERLAIGSAGQALKVNSGATGFEFGTAGGVLQVIQAVKTNTQTFSGLSTTFADISGLSVTITPTSASSKFLLIPSVYMSSASNPSQSRLMRNSTAIFIGDAASNRKRASAQYFGGGQTIEGFHHCYQFLDEPNTSSAITYKLQVSIGGAATHYVNRTGRDADNSAEDARCASSFIVMEIGV